ncbi:unnamed protein product [Medioppia subpectinata]|uniref:PAT complex subunit CCDC47 n=1 Tax=Medioppia subpectinata TaxID=1979941 RepID=A0A7R9PWX2_9ACAR|nr:unnamed protein product [Medioppia subpectinata]CAG2103773.1 unnamed protein product [Medioppia subpectinata]
MGFILSRRSGRQYSRVVSLVLATNLVMALILEICVVSVDSKLASDQQYEDNEFAEFEDTDEDSPPAPPNTKPDATAREANANVGPNASPSAADDEDDDVEEVVDNRNKLNKESDKSDVTVEDEDDDELDDEEFEYVSESDDSGSKSESSADRSRDTAGGNAKKPDLKITNVPLHLRSNWESYYLEFLMIAGLVIYFINFIAGRNKNHKMADTWFDVHKELLYSNFALVGDDGKKEVESAGLNKETESVFTLWCSGRVCVEGMLVELKFLKRQDLVSVVSNYFKPTTDQIQIRVTLNVDAMDSYVFCIANKKSAQRLAKEMNDINTYCPTKKTPEKYGVLGDKFVLLNEIGEAASVLLDAKVISLLKKYEDCIDYIHFTDQYSGYRLAEDIQPTKLPDVKRMLIFAFNFPSNSSRNYDEIEAMKPLLQLVFYSIEKVRRFRLSREGKMKAERNRRRVEELFLKTTHVQRQEVAQLKREERRRAEKEKMLNDSDPEKQRKWEEKEYKRELKRKTPKMKQLKVKAM